MRITRKCPPLVHCARHAETLQHPLLLTFASRGTLRDGVCQKARRSLRRDKLVYSSHDVLFAVCTATFARFIKNKVRAQCQQVFMLMLDLQYMAVCISKKVWRRIPNPWTSQTCPQQVPTRREISREISPPNDHFSSIAHVNETTENFLAKVFFQHIVEALKRFSQRTTCFWGYFQFSLLTYRDRRFASDAMSRDL